MTNTDFNPEAGTGLRTGLGQAPEPPQPAPTNVELESALFHTQNSLGAVIQRLSRGSYTPQAGYNPIDDIKTWDSDDYYRNHGAAFLGSQSPQESQAIKAEIDQGINDRKAITASGWNGTVAGLRIGLVDPTNFLPVGNAARIAKLGLGMSAETALSVGKMAVLQATAQEALLQASLPERSLSESAINIGSSTMLAAMLGAGGVALLAREGLLEKGISSLDDGRIRLSRHNGVMTEPISADPPATGPAGTAADGIPTPEIRQPPAFTVHPTGEFPSLNQMGVSLRDASGQEHYNARLDQNGDVLGINYIERSIPGEPVGTRTGFGAHTRTGMGVDAYQALADWAAQQGKRLSIQPADIAVAGKLSGSALRVQQKLREAGRLVDEDGLRFVKPTEAAPAPGTAAPGVDAEAANTSAVPTAAAVGAAVSDTRNLSPVPYGLDSIPLVGKGVSKMFPNLDVLTNSASPRAKAAITEMVDTPFALQAAKEGQTATRFGGPTIERELKQMREGLHYQVDQEMLKQWGAYLDQGEGGATFLQRQTGLAPAGKMTFDEFDGAVYDALSTGDAHPVPQVAAMAQWMRKNGFDPIKQRAVAAIDGFRETSSRPGESYAPRLWDKEKASKNWNDYVGSWTDHLEAEQAIRAQAQARIEGLRQKLEAAQTGIDKATAKLAKMKEDDLFRGDTEEELIRASTVHDQTRKQLEEEIGAWDGKSAVEAKAALRARAKAEEGRAPEAKRLKSADKAIDSAVKRILESERDLSRQELKARAEEIATRVIGTPEGRLPYDTTNTTGGAGPGSPELRGHAAHREIDIPYEMAKPWLERSAIRALKSYTHSVLPDALLAERFDGDPNLTNVFKDIATDYAAKRASVTSETGQARLQSQMDADIKNVAAMRDRNRGTFAYDPTMQGLARFSQNALKVNNIISSHGMAVSSLPDFAGVVFRNGIESAFKDAWIPFSHALMDNEAWQAVKAAGDEWKAFGIGIETHSASRNHALSDIAEHYRPTSKFERALTWASDKAFIVNLLAPLTDIQKRMATNAVASNILRDAEAVAGGTATQKQIQRLAEGNITQAQAVRIWQQWSNNGGERVAGIILPNMAQWTDQAAARAFRGAVGRDVDIAVVQPGYGEIPKFMSRPGYNVLVQYKKFTMSATQRILIANLQRHDASTMAGMITALGMGMLSYRINTLASGQKASDRVQDWFKEGISRSGMLGVIDDSNSIVSKATGGKADIYRMIGADKPLSKYVSADAASMFLGPSYGKLTNFMKVSRAATHPSEWKESDSHALRMMTLGTNFPYLPRLFDKIEQGANHAFGIPMKAKP